MTIAAVQAAQSPGGLGWTALVVILLFGGIAYLLLIVASSGDEIIGLTEDEPSPEVRPPSPPPPASQPAIPAQAVNAVAQSAADRYTSSLAASIRGIGDRLVQRADLREEERILDAATGHLLTGMPYVALGRSIDEGNAIRGLLRVESSDRRRGRRRRGADGLALAFPREWCDVVISVHSLHQEANPRATLAEWRRVTGRGGRLAASVPGPRAALGLNRYDQIYRRHGVRRKLAVPTPAKLRSWAAAAGWRDIEVDDDPFTTIVVDAEAFRVWVAALARAGTDLALEKDQLDALTRDLLAITPADRGGVRIPYGTLFLTAYNP
jgi:SAM-dependent methyltransferase